jgi:pilus assembly protein CpaE
MAPSGQVRLLLVEDVPQVAQYVRGLLNAQTQVKLIDVIADGSQVMGQVTEQRPDVVVVDGLLQGRLRGMSVVKQLHEAAVGVPVIVLTVPQHPLDPDPENGIHDVLAMPFNGYDLISRVISVNKVAVAAAERGPSRIIAVFAPKGGVGKTTIAFNLAVAASGLGVRTALVDGSIQFADVRALLHVPDAAPSMLDLPTDKVVESDLTDVLWRDASGIDVLLAPPRVEMAEMVVARDIEKTLSLLRRLYDLVIVDTGVGLDELTLAILDQADTILEIVTYDGTTIRNVASMAETFRKIGYSNDKVHYLLNRSDATAGIDPADLRQALGRDPEHHLRSEGQVVGPASNQGLAFVTVDPAAGVSRDLVVVAEQLISLGSQTGRRVAAAAAR